MIVLLTSGRLDKKTEQVVALNLYRLYSYIHMQQEDPATVKNPRAPFFILHTENIEILKCQLSIHLNIQKICNKSDSFPKPLFLYAPDLM